MRLPIRPRSVAPSTASSPPTSPSVHHSAVEEAYHRGFRDGESSLNAQLLQQRNEVAELQQGILQSLRQAVPGVVRETEQALVALTLEVAGKLVSGLPITAEMVQAAVQEALGQLEQTAECQVYLHPEDLQLIQGYARLDGHQYHASPEISRGGCVVKTSFGVIDVRRETKLARIKATVLS